MLLNISLVLVALAVGWIVYLFLEGRAAQRAVAAWSSAKLGEFGVVPQGNPLGAYALRGHVHGVELVAQSKDARCPPGAREGDPKETVSAITLSLALPDLVVCRNADVDSVMGPLPAVPRTPTGHDDFENTYSLFISGVGARDPDRHGGYREPAAANPIVWAKPPVLDRLKELDLEWMRVRDGVCEVVFKPLLPEDMVRAVVTSVNLSRTLAGAALLPVRAGARAANTDPSEPATLALLSPVIGGFLAMFPGAILNAVCDLPGLETSLCCIAGGSLLTCAVASASLRQLKKGPPWSSSAAESEESKQ